MTNKKKGKLLEYINKNIECEEQNIFILEEAGFPQNSNIMALAKGSLYSLKSLKRFILEDLKYGD